MTRRARLALFLLVTLVVTISSHSSRADSLKHELDELSTMLKDGDISRAEFEQLRRAAIARHTSSTAPAFFCSFDGSARRMDLKPATGYSPNANAQRVVKEILDQAGMAPSFVVRSDPRVDNAAAAVVGEERYILYNTQFVDQMKNETGTNWSVYSVMAHELGHHLLGHTLRPGGSRPAQEIEADEYSGFILAQLGAPLGQSQVAMRTLASADATATHPGKADRVSAIARGHKRGMVALTSGRTAAETRKKPQPVSEPDEDDDDNIIDDEEPPAKPPRAQPISRRLPRQPTFGSRCCSQQTTCPLMLPGSVGDSCWCATIYGGFFTGAVCR
jgi:hypothetical protein